MQNKLLIIAAITVFSFAFDLNGQKMVTSPFARFNLGSLEHAGPFRGMAMGGTGIAMRDNSSLYFSNPASYSSIDTNSFVFDFGLDFSISVISGNTSRYKSDDMNFHHLIIGFPLARNFGFACGLVPYSNGYYNLYQPVLKGDPGYNETTGEYSTYHQGSGNLSNFFVGTGINITSNIAIGANMTIMSGKIERANQFVFSSYTNGFSTNLYEKFELRGINFDLGLQYMAHLKKDYFLIAGASITSRKSYKSIYENGTLMISGYSAIDTITYSKDNLTKAIIPYTMKLGISLGKKNKFVAGIDYLATKWTHASLPGVSGYLADSKNINLGVEFIPDKFSNYSYFNRIEYRIGAHFADSYLIINGKQIRELGVSAGLGLMMKRSPSKTNIFFDLTRKDGPTNSGFKYENYYTMGISINLWDGLWFWQRKYD
jgi:hypothetical protein